MSKFLDPVLYHSTIPVQVFEFLDPVLSHSIIPTQAFQWILIVRRKVLRVRYSFLQKKEVATKFNQDTEEFFNPKITKVEVTAEGSPNELYAQNIEYRHQYDEIMKHFGKGRLKDAGAIQKDLQLHYVNMASNYTNKYALWLDCRTIDENRLHGSGRRLENTSEGFRLQITKESGSAGKLSCYLYIFQEAQINI